MTEQQHPITPPPELFRQWEGMPRSLAFEAAYRAGANQELEACIEWMKTHLHSWPCLYKKLRAARRPEPPSLAEQALDAAKEMSFCMSHGFVPKRSNLDIIRAALERLQKLEQQENNDN